MATAHAPLLGGRELVRFCPCRRRRTTAKGRFAGDQPPLRVLLRLRRCPSPPAPGRLPRCRQARPEESGPAAPPHTAVTGAGGPRDNCPRWRSHTTLNLLRQPGPRRGASPQPGAAERGEGRPRGNRRPASPVARAGRRGSLPGWPGPGRPARVAAALGAGCARRAGARLAHARAAGRVPEKTAPSFGARMGMTSPPRGRASLPAREHPPTPRLRQRGPRGKGDPPARMSESPCPHSAGAPRPHRACTYPRRARALDARAGDGGDGRRDARRPPPPQPPDPTGSSVPANCGTERGGGGSSFKVSIIRINLLSKV
ncbi:unnamed protein product [Lepidochelys kempii]